METIISWVYNPKISLFKSSKNDRAKVFYKKCSNKENCKLYLGKKCLLLNSYGLSGNMNCIYGESLEQEGFTQKAGSFYKWMQEKEEKSCGKDFSKTGKGIFEVGEYFVFVFDYIEKIDFGFDEENSKLFKRYNIIRKNLFDLEVINKFINHRPRTIWGDDIIKDYEKKMIPLFIENIKYKFPELYKQIPEEIKNKYIISNIGRGAYIKTMTVGSELNDCQGNKYLWDGKKLICEDYRLSFNFFKGKTRIESIPLDNEVYKITDESQVNENTIYKD